MTQIVKAFNIKDEAPQKVEDTTIIVWTTSKTGKTFSEIKIVSYSVSEDAWYDDFGQEYTFEWWQPLAPNPYFLKK